MTINADQLPEGWSEGAEGYQDNFAGFTGLYADPVLDLLGVSRGTELPRRRSRDRSDVVACRRRGAVVTAVDFAPAWSASRHSGGEAGHGDAAVREMDGQALDLADASFERRGVDVRSDVLPGCRRRCRGASRVVRAGGRLAIGTWDLDVSACTA